MKLSWLDASEAEKFGRSLALIFAQAIPIAAGRQKNKTIAKKLGVADLMYAQLEQFKHRQKPNVYQKARLWRAFKSELMAAGYESELIDQVMKGLMLRF
jgi:hypothetical protein